MFQAGFCHVIRALTLRSDTAGEERYSQDPLTETTTSNPSAFRTMPHRRQIVMSPPLRRYATTQLPPQPASTFKPAYTSIPIPKLPSKSIPSSMMPTSDRPHYISPPDRIYTQRKAFLYAYYAHLLKRSSLVLLFTHDNLSVPDTNRLRAAIKRVPIPPPPALTIKTSRGRKKRPENTGPQPVEAVAVDSEGAQLTVLRTGVFGALARTTIPSASLAPYLDGQTALLTCPSLSPTYLSALLRTINRSLTAAKRPAVRDKEVKQPNLRLVAGVLEGNRLVGVEELGRVGKLPELDTLRGQVVGLLEGSGKSLVGLLAQAGGGVWSGLYRVWRKV